MPLRDIHIQRAALAGARESFVAGLRAVLKLAGRGR